MTRSGSIPPRVLLVAEGASELGAAPSEHRGALTALVARLLDRELEVECERASSPKVQIHRGHGAAFTKRALAWIRHAQREGFDALVLLIDHDGDGERQKQLDVAQRDAHFSLPRALGVAIRTFDAWMLADERALSQVLDFPVDKQKSPEDMSDPKATVHALREQGAESLLLPELYWRISEQLRLELLISNCPKGFGQFAQRVRIF